MVALKSCRQSPCVARVAGLVNRRSARFAQCIEKMTRGWKAFIWIFRQQAIDHRLITRQGRGERRRHGVAMRVEDVGQGVASEWQAAGQHLVEDDPETI